jgi:CheY-like chemotaxis protein
MPAACIGMAIAREPAKFRLPYLVFRTLFAPTDKWTVMVSIFPVERRVADVVEPNPQRSDEVVRAPSSVSGTTPASRPGQPVVLIVDDDPAVRAVVEMALRQQGFDTRAAATGLEAVAIYQKQPGIDLVLIDVRMPGLDGPQTLKALREIDGQVRCCFVSGDTGEYEQQELLKMGVAHIFEKPFSLAELAGTIRGLIAR